MILAHNLSDETKKLVENLKSKIDNFEGDENGYLKFVKKISEDFYEIIYEQVKVHFGEDLEFFILDRVAWEVHKIMTSLLNSDQETMRTLGIFSKYTMEQLHEIRLKIFEVGASEIQKSIIKAQQDEIARLKSELKYYQRDHQY